MPPSPQERRLRDALISVPAPSVDEELAGLPELEREIARSSDPQIREILVQEHNRLKGLIPARLGAEEAEEPETSPFFGPTQRIRPRQTLRDQGLRTGEWWRHLPEVIQEKLPSAEDSEEEQVQKTLNLLMFMMPGRSAGGTVGVLAGEKGALRAGGETLRRFLEGKKAQEGGVGGQRLWRDFGVAPGAEGALRWEIPDTPMRVADIPPVGPAGVTERLYRGPLQGAVEHPQLFEAYPELKGVYAKIHQLRERAPEALERGAYSESFDALFAAAKPQNLRSLLSHEIQHGVQGVEGFARGASVVPNVAESGVDDELVKLLTQIGYGRTPELRQYARHAGETEARNVQTRLADPSLRSFMPEWTEDIPRVYQILSRP